MLTCREATHLMSEEQDRELRMGERAGLGMHLVACRGCRQYRRQMDFLRKACRRFLVEKTESGGPVENRNS